MRGTRSVTPRQKLVNLTDLVVGDAAEHSELGSRIDAVEFRRFDQGVGDSRRTAAVLGLANVREREGFRDRLGSNL